MSQHFWIRAVIESDMSPRLRVVLEFVCVIGILMIVTAIAVREGLRLSDKVMVAESAFITTNNRVDAILALSESGRWAQSDAGPNTGAYSSAQWRADGSSVVTFSESFGSQGLRGRQVVWALKQSTPWTSNVLSWSCRSVDTDENGAEPASLPEFCRE